VASFTLTETSSLRAHADVDADVDARAARHSGDAVPGVVIAEQIDVAICSVLARRGATDRLARAVQSAFALELPLTPHYAGNGTVAFAWAGPGQWLALGERMTGPKHERQLRAAVGDAAAIIDQSHGRTLIRISGPRAREALAKGVLIDLHPAAFGAGSTASTVISHMGVHFWQVDAGPTYEVSVAGSFALSFLEWLTEAAAELGVAYRPGR
jgi:methylglutamate dehydrogenase subunit D